MRIRLKDLGLMNPTFIVHLFASEFVQAQIIRLSTGMTRFGLTKPKWESLIFPVPPLKVQQEIVETLDEYEELEEGLKAELEAELEARKTQKAYVLSEFQKGNLPKQNSSKLMTLKELVYFENGKPQEKFVQPDGDCELITSKFISTNGVRARRINYSDTRTPALKGDIAIVLSDLPNGRALARCFFVDKDRKYAVNQRIAILRSLNIEIADPEYLFHYVNRNPQVLKYDNGSTQTNLKQADVVNISIHLPDIKTQREIAQELTSLELFVNEISVALPAEINSRKQQFELCRNKLLTFKELIFT
jgi:type I restriction enzyme S subunit